MCADDSAFDVLAVRSHVRFGSAEVVVRLAVWLAPDGWDDVLADIEARAVGVCDDTDGLVAEYHVVCAVGKSPVATADYLVVGAIDTDAECPNERLAVFWFRSGFFHEFRRITVPMNGDRFHTSSVKN